MRTAATSVVLSGFVSHSLGPCCPLSSLVELVAHLDTHPKAGSPGRFCPQWGTVSSPPSIRITLFFPKSLIPKIDLLLAVIILLRFPSVETSSTG